MCQYPSKCVFLSFLWISVSEMKQYHVFKTQPAALRGENASGTGCHRLATGRALGALRSTSLIKADTETPKVCETQTRASPDLDTHVILRHHSFIHLVELFDVHSVHVELH